MPGSDHYILWLRTHVASQLGSWQTRRSSARWPSLPYRQRSLGRSDLGGTPDRLANQPDRVGRRAEWELRTRPQEGGRFSAAGHETPHVLVEGYSYGSLSMTCVAAGMDEQPAAPPGTNVGDRAGAPRLGSVPPDQSNI